MSDSKPGRFVIYGDNPIEDERKAHEMTAKVYSKSLDRTTSAMNALQEEIEDAHRILDAAGISRTDDLDHGARTMTLVQRVEDMAAQWEIARDWQGEFEKETEAIQSGIAVVQRFRPTAECVNALPDALRHYIHDLETRCDPAGDVARATLAEDTIECLRKELAEHERIQSENDSLICKISELERYSPDQHVIPESPGERQHATSVLCWCRPRRDEEDPRVVIHERKAEA